MDTKERKVFAVGVGMTKFLTPGSHPLDYPDLIKEAVVNALNDALITYKDIEQAFVGYVYGDSGCGQRALYEVGMTGIPIYNINNTASSGSTAMYLAKQLIENGSAECILVVGFDKMEKGSPGAKYFDRVHPLNKHIDFLDRSRGLDAAPIAVQFYSNAGKEHMEKYGTKPEQFAKIALKNHRHATKNPYAQFQNEYSLEDIQNSRMIHYPLTKLQCCPTSDGAAAVVVASEAFAKKAGLQDKAVEILGMEMCSDLPSTFEEGSSIKLIGFDMMRNAALALYKKTGINPGDIDVIELQDSFSVHELISYEALGLCDIGKGGELVDSGNNTYGGKHVVNPSGGLISKGHPFGATGVAQCVELCWQLRGEAGERQVEGAKLALQHNIGLGCGAIVAAYKLACTEEELNSTIQEIDFPEVVKKLKSFPHLSKLLGSIINAVKKKKSRSNFSGSFMVKVKYDDSNREAIGVVSISDRKMNVKFDPIETKVDFVVSLTDSVLYDLLMRKYSLYEGFVARKFEVLGNADCITKAMNLKNKFISKL